MMRTFLARAWAAFVAWWHQDDPAVPPVTPDTGDDL